MRSAASRATLCRRARNVKRVAEIHLPLSEDDTVVNMIFTVVAFHSD